MVENDIMDKDDIPEEFRKNFSSELEKLVSNSYFFEISPEFY